MTHHANQPLHDNLTHPPNIPLPQGDGDRPGLQHLLRDRLRAHGVLVVHTASPARSTRWGMQQAGGDVHGGVA